jgi:hypothetical protein
MGEINENREMKLVSVHKASDFLGYDLVSQIGLGILIKNDYPPCILLLKFHWERKEEIQEGFAAWRTQNISELDNIDEGYGTFPNALYMIRLSGFKYKCIPQIQQTE